MAQFWLYAASWCILDPRALEMNLSAPTACRLLFIWRVSLAAFAATAGASGALRVISVRQRRPKTRPGAEKRPRGRTLQGVGLRVFACFGACAARAALTDQKHE